MKILVIGSEGFIGKHLMEQGRELGHEMLGCDIVGKPDWNSPIASLTKVDIVPFERVIDCAGVLGTEETLQDPEAAVHGNVLSVLHLLRLCREASVPMTYVTLGNQWLNPYSITKNCAAQFVRMFNVVCGLPTQVAVAYNVFGPYQKWKPVRKIVPEFMTRLIQGKHVELFFGGNTLVDMVFAPDLARALLENTQTSTRHYGSGVPRRVVEVAQDCADALGVKLEFVKLGPRDGETAPAALAPYPLANQTDYKTAMQVTAKWYRENFTQD